MRAVIPIALLAFAAHAAVADTVRVAASQDATLIEDPGGALANGSGPALFAGRNNQSENSIRRALVKFDVAATLPEGAIIEDVSLTLFMTPSNPAPRALRLHRVLREWSEGPSSASGGGGAPSEPGDATWIHTSYDGEEWVHAGGDYVGRASAAEVVAESGSYTWGGAGHMDEDVRLWRAAPHRNFGWILLGDEAEPQTAKNFASREHPDAALRPVLEITYRVPGDPPGR